MGCIDTSFLTPDRAPTYFRAYLKALRLSCAEPDDASLLESSGHILTAHDLRLAFDGPSVPQWTVVRPLAAALVSRPGDIRPMWLAAYSSPDAMRSTTPAESF
jgi:hypothetical protein